jgi:hypothetical protein
MLTFSEIVQIILYYFFKLDTTKISVAWCLVFFQIRNADVLKKLAN